MSNVTLFQGGQVPAFARNRKELSAIGKALIAGASNRKRVSIKGGVFRLMVGGKQVAAIEERYLDVVVVAAAPTNARKYYEGEFDENNSTPPDCWSNDGITPDPQAKKKQCTDCKSCPQNIKGSGKEDSRACRFERRLALVLANDIEGDVLGLAVPGASIFSQDDGENRGLQGYARFLAAQNVDPGEVITRMKFDTSVANPKLFFKPMRWLTDEEFAVVQEKANSEDAKDAVTLTVAAQDGAAPASAPIEGALGARPQRSAKPTTANTDPETGEIKQDDTTTRALSADVAAAEAQLAAQAAAKKKKAEAARLAAEAARLAAEAAAAEAEEEEAPPPPPKPTRSRKADKDKVQDVVDKAEAGAAAAATEVEEPTVRATEGKPSQVPVAGNLASMVDDWDDE